MQYLGEILDNQVNNGKTTSTPRPQGNQSILELTRDPNNPEFNLVSRTEQNTTISNTRITQNPTTTTGSFFEVNTSLPSIFRMEQPLPVTSHRVRFHPSLLDTPIPQNIGMPPISSTISMVPGVLNTSAGSSQIPITTITNVVLNSVLLYLLISTYYNYYLYILY